MLIFSRLAIPVSKQEEENRQPDLPDDVESLVQGYTWRLKECPPTGYVVPPALEFTHMSEEGRIVMLAQGSMVVDDNRLEPVGNRIHSIIRAIIKVGTSH